MKLYLVSVKDRKAGVFTSPQCVVRLEAALRSFADNVNDPRPDNMWFKHPEDFELWHVGSFDDQTGKVAVLVEVALLACGDEYKKQQALPFGNGERVPANYGGTG